MPLRSHLRLLGLAIAVWSAFWLAGLPRYYQQYSLGAMVAFCVALVPLVVLAARRMIGQARPERRRALGLWLAGYFSVPLLALDYWYCGIRLGLGWSFLRTHWYLTAFYFVPWLVFVPVGLFKSRSLD